MKMQIPVIQPFLRSSGTGMLILFIIAVSIGSGAVMISQTTKPPSVTKGIALGSVGFMSLLINMAVYYLLGLNKLGPNWQILFQLIGGIGLLGILAFAYCNSSQAAMDRCNGNPMLKSYVRAM